MTQPTGHPETGIFWQKADIAADMAPVILRAGNRCGEAVNAMCEAGASAALIVDDQGHIIGIITEQDVVRRLAFRASEDTVLSDVMTTQVKTIVADDYLYHAIIAMQRHGLRHIPLVDSHRHPVGMLRLSSALSAIAPQRLAQVDLLAQENTADGLRETKAVQVEIARQLFSENIAAPHILQVLSHFNAGIYRDILTKNIDAMAREGLGPPPVDFAVIIMGSGGREESYLHPDQDNGFILADYPDDQHERIDGWFIELADRLTIQLDETGIPLCNGYVMAVNPLWRKTISQWKAQTTGWIKKQTPMAIRFADIFFDFQGVFGNQEMVLDLQRHIARNVKNAHGFLRLLYHDDAGAGVPLGWFGRLQTIRNDPDHSGQLNMKHSGLLPLVQSVRLLALRAGIQQTSTLARIEALGEANLLSRDLSDDLVGAMTHMSFLLLRHQIDRSVKKEPVDNYVRPAGMTRRERRVLVNSFKAVRALHNKARSEILGDVF